MKFTKDDKNKPNLAILFDTPNALASVANVMQFGANKYNRLNWNKVDDYERYISAALRHISEYLNKRPIDIESNEPHLAHAITSLLFVLELEKEK